MHSTKYLILGTDLIISDRHDVMLTHCGVLRQHSHRASRDALDLG